MTKDEQRKFGDSQEQEEFQIWVEDYDCDYFWGIGETTFLNEYSLVIRGEWRLGAVERKPAIIDISQIDDDPKKHDDVMFRDVAPVEYWDMATVGAIEVATTLHVYVALPRSAILALITMLSAAGEKKVCVTGSTLEKISLFEGDGGDFEKGRLHQIWFRLENRIPRGRGQLDNATK